MFLPLLADVLKTNRGRKRLDSTGMIRSDHEASAQVSIHMMEVSISNQRSQPANTCAKKLLPLLKGAVPASI